MDTNQHPEGGLATLSPEPALQERSLDEVVRLNEQRLRLVEELYAKAHYGLHNAILDLQESESSAEWLTRFLQIKASIAKANYETEGAIFGLMDERAEAIGDPRARR